MAGELVQQTSVCSRGVSLMSNEYSPSFISSMSKAASRRSKPSCCTARTPRANWAVTIRQTRRALSPFIRHIVGSLARWQHVGYWRKKLSSRRRRARRRLETRLCITNKGLPQQKSWAFFFKEQKKEGREEKKREKAKPTCTLWHSSEPDRRSKWQESRRRWREKDRVRRQCRWRPAGGAK